MMLDKRLRLQGLFVNGDVIGCIDEKVQVKLIALLPRQLNTWIQGISLVE